jgi:probable rRNA maturation factor
VPSLNRPGEVCVAFVSDGRIRRVNRRFLKHDHATDVIAFRYPRGARGRGLPFGDVFVSLDHAKAQARKGGYPVRQEAALLVAHGLLHLAGYRDRTRALRSRMFARQRLLFRQLAPGLAPPDFR